MLAYLNPDPDPASRGSDPQSARAHSDHTNSNGRSRIRFPITDICESASRSYQGVGSAERVLRAYTNYHGRSRIWFLITGRSGSGSRSCARTQGLHELFSSHKREMNEPLSGSSPMQSNLIIFKEEEILKFLMIMRSVISYSNFIKTIY